MADVDTGSTANTSTWQVTSVLEYPSSYFAGDNDDDTTNAEAAFSNNLSMPLTLSTGMALTGMHFAARFRSNATTLTNSVSVRDYAGINGVNGWTAVGTTSANTTYRWTDSWLSSEIRANPYNYVDTVANRTNLRLRTSASTAVAAGTVNDWDFAMASIRWLDSNTGTLNVDIVDNSGNSVATPNVSFSNLTTSNACQTSTATFGTSSEKIRVYNTTSQPQWSLTLAATSGTTSLWQTSGSERYDFNDASGSPAGCGEGADADSYAGQLSIDFSSAVITPEPGCSATGISLGSGTAFDEGTVDNIQLAQASGSADTGCYWDITNIQVTQMVPGGQPSGSYDIEFNLSIVAN